MKAILLFLAIALLPVEAAAWTAASVNGLQYYVDGSHIAIPVQLQGRVLYYTVYNYGPAIRVFLPQANGTYRDLYIGGGIYENTLTGWQPLACSAAQQQAHRDQTLRLYQSNATDYWAVWYKTDFFVADRLLSACHSP